MANDFLFTSESVSEGHPDKVADQISDAILDAIFKQDPRSRVAAETLCNTGLVVLAGEITTNAHVDYIQVARDTIKRIGYDNTEYGIDYKGCAVMVAYDKQSNDIAQGVDQASDDHLEHRRRRPGPDVRLRLRRDARADARADLLRAPPGRAPGAAAPRRPHALPAPRRQEPGDDALRRRQAALDRHRRAVDPARARDERRQDDEAGVRRGGDRGDHQAGAAQGVAEEHALPRSTRPAASSSAARKATAASPAARSSSTPTAAPARTAAARSAARTRARSTARPPMPRATWPRTSSPPASPSSARSRSPTPSAWPSR